MQKTTKKYTKKKTIVILLMFFFALHQTVHFCQKNVVLGNISANPPRELRRPTIQGMGTTFLLKLTAPEKILGGKCCPVHGSRSTSLTRHATVPLFAQELWGWLEPYVDDEEEFSPSPTEGSMTMGAWVRKIIRCGVCLASR